MRQKKMRINQGERWKKLMWRVGVPLLLLFIVHRSLPHPQLVLNQPDANLQPVIFDEPFLVQFDQVMHQPSVNKAFSITPHLDGQLSWDDSKTLRFLPDQPLEIEDEYQIRIQKNAQSRWIRPLNFDASINFIVTGPPFVQFAHPGPEEIIAENGVFTVMFDQAMDFEAMDPKKLLRSEPPLEGEFKWIGKSAFQFIPSDLESKKTYQLTVPAGLPATAGGASEEAFIWSVRTPLAQVIKSEPTPYQTVDLQKPLKIEFDQAIDLAQIQPGDNAQLFPSNDIDADINSQNDGFFNADIRYEMGENGEFIKNKLVFTPSFPYQSGQTYHFVLKGGDSFQLEQDFELYFRTEAPEGELEKAPEEQSLGWIKNPFVFTPDEPMRLELSNEVKATATFAACPLSALDYLKKSESDELKTHECATLPTPLATGPDSTISSIDMGDYLEKEVGMGIYYARLQTETEQLWATVWQTNIHLLIKKNQNGWLVWATDRDTGQPLPDLTVEVLSAQGGSLQTGLTSAEGLVLFEGIVEDDFFVQAQQKIDGTLAYWGMASRPLAKPSASNNQNQALWSAHQTHYQPGDVLKVFGGIQAHKPPLKAVLSGPTGGEMGEFTIEVGASGQFQADIPLDFQLSNGSYQLHLKDENGQLNADSLRFFVSDQKGMVDLRWLDSPNDIGPTANSVFELKAEYQNGLPATAMEGVFKWYKISHPHREKRGRQQFVFDPVEARCQTDCGQTTLVDQAEFKVGSTGKIAANLGTAEAPLEIGNYLLVAEIYQNNRIISQVEHAFAVSPGAWQLGLAMDHHLYNKNQAVEGSFLLLDNQKIPVTTQPIRISLWAVEDGKKAFFSDVIEAGNEVSRFSIPLDVEMEPGRYELRLEAEDEANNITQTSTEITVRGDDEDPLFEEIKLLSDRTHYPTDGRAHLLLSLPKASEEDPISVLLSYEQGDKMQGQQVLNVTTALTEIKVPIEADHFPQVNLVASYFDPSTSSIRSDEASVNITQSVEVFDTHIELDPPNPRPGEEMTVRFALKNELETPVQANMAVNVMEEENGNNVFLNRAVKINAEGQGQVTFKLPQTNHNLTISTLAISAGGQVSQANMQIPMHDTLLLRPVLPGPLSPGDQSTLGVSVKNVSSEKANLTLQLEADYLTVSNPLQNFSIEAGEEKQLNFEVLIDPQVTETSIKLKFLTQQDSISIALPLRQETTQLDVMKVGKLPSFWSTIFDLPSAHRSQTGQMKVRLGVDPMVLSHAGYEQWMEAGSQNSWNQAHQLLASLAMEPDDESVETGQQKKVNRLLAAMDEWGGVGFWEDGYSTPQTTAIAAWSLAQAKNAGLTVDDEAINTMLNYLFEQLSQEGITLHDEALVLWVLSEHGQYDTKRSLELLQKMPPEAVRARAFLLMNLANLNQAGQTGVNAFVEGSKQELASLVQRSRQGVFFQENSHTDRVQTTAIVLYALARLDAENPLLNEIVTYLGAQPTHASDPFNAGEIMWTVLAWQQWGQVASLGEEALSARVRFNGEILKEVSLTEGVVPKIFTLTAPSEQLRSEVVNDLLVQTSGEELYMDAHLLSYLTPEKLDSIESGVIVDRMIYQKGDEKMAPVTYLRAGEIYMNRLLLVVPEPLQGVVVEDAGLPGAWLNPLSSHFPFDRITVDNGGLYYFANELPAGVYVLESELHALLPGDYAHSPATLSSLLQPGVHGRTAGGRVLIGTF